MNEQEALTRVKTGNFNGGYGFDMQLLVDAVGIIGEMFKGGGMINREDESAVMEMEEKRGEPNDIEEAGESR